MYLACPNTGTCPVSCSSTCKEKGSIQKESMGLQAVSVHSIVQQEHLQINQGCVHEWACVCFVLCVHAFPNALCSGIVVLMRVALWFPGWHTGLHASCSLLVLPDRRSIHGTSMMREPMAAVHMCECAAAGLSTKAVSPPSLTAKAMRGCAAGSPSRNHMCLLGSC